MWQQFVMFITFCAGRLAEGADVEIDANIRVDPNFAKSIKESVDKQIELFGVTNEIQGNEDPIMEYLKVYAENEPKRAMMQDNIEIILAYVKRSLQKGADSIESIAGYLEKELKVKHADIIPVVKKMISSYNLQIDKYIKKLINVPPNSDIDEEYMILDMVNIVSLITRNIQRKLLENIIALGTNEDKEILISTLATFNDIDKRQEVEFVCENFVVCRPNPAFSGYVYKLLEEILKLKADKLRYFVIKTAKSLRQSQSFIETLLEKNVTKWFKTEIDHISEFNDAQIKRAVLSLYSVVLRRYHIEGLDSIEIQPNTRAKAILVDIIDIAVGLDGDSLYGAQMNGLITEVKDWSSNIAINVDGKIDDTIKYIIKALERNLTRRGKMEIITLVDIIFYKQSKEDIAKENMYLMTEGSTFVHEMLHRIEQQ